MILQYMKPHYIIYKRVGASIIWGHCTAYEHKWHRVIWRPVEPAIDAAPMSSTGCVYAKDEDTDAMMNHNSETPACVQHSYWSRCGANCSDAYAIVARKDNHLSNISLVPSVIWKSFCYIFYHFRKNDVSAIQSVNKFTANLTHQEGGRN